MTVSFIKTKTERLKIMKVLGQTEAMKIQAQLEDLNQK